MDFKKTIEAFKKILNLKDCPYKLAKSLSLGFGLALLPLPGMNIFLSAVLAKLLRLNILAATLPGILLISVSPFLYVLNYKTGAMLIKSPEPPPEQMDIPYDLSFFSKIVDFFTHLGTAYLLGSFINACLVALLAYIGFLAFYKSAQKRTSSKDISENQSGEHPADEDLMMGFCNTKMAKNKPSKKTSG
ncbi:DUF2062 domain-containing protein [Desulfofalx alkaliphila]|uniref:DUF2062 domain-containing protein n=1 Tax=Desulfofalx alkaliphila TaxID=105483 RepID=UPI0004E17876|nr:DUF2062 domain-containing protein [Desulfofalx alkaliphila]